jgi:hypothetical protein
MTEIPQIPELQIGDDPISKMLLSAVNKAGSTLFNAETLQAIKGAGSSILTVISPVATVATNLTQAAMTTVASLSADSPTRVDQTSTASNVGEAVAVANGAIDNLGTLSPPPTVGTATQSEGRFV